MPRNGEPQSQDSAIAVVERALDLLESLARIGPASLADLATATNCTRTAAFRLLRTLQARGFAIQDGARGAWRLGARWGGLGNAAAAQGALQAAAKPYLLRLAERTGETAFLRIRDGLETDVIALIPTRLSAHPSTALGRRRPLHVGGSRLLLAYAPLPVQAQVLTQRLLRFTPATRTDPAWIAADLNRIRNRGYLVSEDEVTFGTMALAAPVRDATGQVVAALSIAAPTERMRPPRPQEVVPMLLETAEALSRSLGAPTQPGRLPLG